MITNYLSPLEFKIQIERLPNVSFFTQRISVPGINANPVEHPTRFNPLYVLPDRLQYSQLNLSFIIDEYMKNYIEIFKWMEGITFPQDHDQYREVKTSKHTDVSDITVTMLTSKKNPSVSFKYYSCFPISLTQMDLDTTNADVVYPEANVTFQYNYFKIETH